MEPTPRRFWQIHLSTAVILTFVAGCLVGVDIFFWRELLPEFRLNGSTWIAIAITLAFYVYVNVHILTTVAIYCESRIRQTSD